MSDTRVLGIDVSDRVLAQWSKWFAPDPQPFLVAEKPPERNSAELRDEVRDTYNLYGLAARGLSVWWLREVEYLALPRRERADFVRLQVELGRGLVPTVKGSGREAGPSAREQADGHRFVWWPSLLNRGNRRRVLSRYVTGARRPSRHREVEAKVWRLAERLLPDARRVAGVFPSQSGPNCFGAVMAAAGVAGADGLWMQRAPFEEWLAAAASPTTAREGAALGVVMVWRDTAGDAQHAAVTLGGGWALHKPSQGWMSPTMVLTAAEVIRSARFSGIRLYRYAIHD